MLVIFNNVFSWIAALTGIVFCLPYFMKDEYKKLILQSIFGMVCVVANIGTMITDILLGNCYAVSFVLVIFWSIITVVLYEFAKYDKAHVST